MSENAVIHEGKAWSIWMEELATKAQNTKRLYLGGFKKFHECWGVDPEELYKMRLEDLKAEDPRDHRRIERMVKTQMAELHNAGVSASTCNNVKKSLSSFFEAQNLELHFKRKDSIKGAYNGSRAVTPEIVAAMHDNVVFLYKLRNRAIILSLKDMGIRISDLAGLNVGEYLGAKTIYKEARQPFKVFQDSEETQKMKVPAYIHLGPESVLAIDEYLQERRNNGEELTPDRPLFTNQLNTRQSREREDRMLSNSITAIFVRLKKWLPNKGHKISSHSLRKFHRTRLEGAGMPEGWVKKLQGKKASVYSQPEFTGELTEKYIDCYHALRIFGEKVSAQKLDEQATEIDGLRAQLGEYERKFDAIQAEKEKTEDTMSKILRALEKKGIKIE